MAVSLCKHLVRFLSVATFSTCQVKAWPTFGSQIPLAGNVHKPALIDLPIKISQNSSLCDAGSPQWTGTVPVGDGRGLFYWYFESRHDPENAPLVIWFNGGPGASSLLGAFHEIGPCKVNGDADGTIRNELSWTNHANMLFVDQPVGVGFARPVDPNLWSANLVEAGVDFIKFLDTFLDDLFPQLNNRPVHLAGESFGGKYVPIYASMSRRRFDSIILVDALVNFPKSITGLYKHVCAHGLSAVEEDRPSRHLNETSCAAMEEHYPDCERAARLCDLVYDGKTCMDCIGKCTELYTVYLAEVVPGGRNPYDDRLTCVDPPMCGRLGMEEVTAYLNRDGIQKALGFREPFKFETVNMAFNAKWATQSDVFVPSTREIEAILDDKKTPLLVLNGNNDVVVNSEGVIRSYEDMLWSGHARFKHQALQPWTFSRKGEVTVTGRFKQTANLMVVIIDEAGHMSPLDQPVAVSDLVQKWLKYGPDVKRVLGGS